MVIIIIKVVKIINNTVMIESQIISHPSITSTFKRQGYGSKPTIDDLGQNILGHLLAFVADLCDKFGNFSMLQYSYSVKNWTTRHMSASSVKGGSCLRSAYAGKYFILFHVLSFAGIHSLLFVTPCRTQPLYVAQLS